MVSEAIKNYSWGDYDLSKRDIKVLDTSLRDGEQSGVIKLPSLSEETEYVDELVKSGFIDAVDISLPFGRGARLKHSIELAKRIPEHISVVCLARTKATDIEAAIELSQRSGRSIEGIIFVGSSNQRRSVEKWNLDHSTCWMAENVARACKEGIIPIVATEHTTETDPEAILKIFRAGLENGGKKVCIADTTGIATPEGARSLVRFFRKVVLEGYPGIEVQWHGHDDRDLAVANSFAALKTGADTVHVTVLGVGERAGNTKLEPMLANLQIAGDPKRQDISKVRVISEIAARIFHVPVADNYPIVGKNNRIVASGIHASAHRKARLIGVKSPYEPFDPENFGFEKTKVAIGPKSGEANVLEVAERLGLNVSQRLINKLLETANDLNKILTDEEVVSITYGLNGNGDNNVHG